MNQFLGEHKTRIILCISLMIAMSCFATGVSAGSSRKCDSKKIEVIQNGEVVWSGTAADIFKKYPHGKLGVGNRPERETVRLSKLIKDLEAEKATKVSVIACRNKSKQLAITDIVRGDIDIWLVGLRSGDIRIFEYKKGSTKPKRDFKRIVRIEFIK